MHVPVIDKGDLRFPPMDTATPEGLLAMGGDLCSERLLAAYRRGIFPWYSDGQPILWWSPDPRAVLYPSRLKVSRSLDKTLRKQKYEVTLDREFDKVIRACAGPRSSDPDSGTWITEDMINAYGGLHQLGFAHSVECWLGDQLAGGLYGIAIGRAFFGESMFSHATDASKIGLVHLVRQLQRWEFVIIDCQLPSAHLFRFGAEKIPRVHFMQQLGAAIARPGRHGPWRLDSDQVLND